MNDLQGKKFIASYSGGKDSIFAIYKAVKSGLEPHGLITAYNSGAGRSWFHGLPENIIRQVSDSLAMPVRLIKTSGEQYEENFEKVLASAKSDGAEVCVFGDIDVASHIEWCALRCEKAGIVPYLPLFGMERKRVVYDFIDSGFSATITIVDTSRLSKDFLGQVLSRDVADSIEKSGADICGENGEYHSFVFDGPIFKNKIDFSVKEKVEKGKQFILKIN